MLSSLHEVSLATFLKDSKSMAKERAVFEWEWDRIAANLMRAMSEVEQLELKLE